MMDFVPVDEEMLDEHRTLFELTGHESGIIVFPGNEIAVTNWGSWVDDYRLPVITPFCDVFPWPCGADEWNRIECADIANICDELPVDVQHIDDTHCDLVANVLTDPNGDIERLYNWHLYKRCLSDDDDSVELAATCYKTLDGVLIYTISEWC